MRFKIIFILLIITFSSTDLAFAQNTPAKKDAPYLYDTTKSFSVNSKFSRFIYRLLFKPLEVNPSGMKVKRKVYKKLIQKPYSDFEGKTIRHIHIVTLDPFSYSIGDTIKGSLNFLTRPGNNLHLKSQTGTIRNLLLIRPNQRFDSLLVKESERLVRKKRYVTDVSFFVLATSKRSDSVDIFIRELDTWSIIPKVSSSSSGFTITLIDRNFLGLGHEFQNVFARNYPGENTAFNTNYVIPNISTTNIGTILHYGIDNHGNFNRSITVDRPFFSSFSKWAGGVSFAQQYHQNTLYVTNLPSDLLNYKMNAQDYWVGHAIQLFKGISANNRTTDFISAARFLRVRYPEKPNEIYDSLHVFSNEDFYLTAIGISTRKYVQDKFIFNFGLTEDVPIGKVYGLTGGYQEKNNVGRVYLGARISIGNYHPWGYFSSSYEYGTFFRGSHAEQGVFSASIIYFTGLIEMGKWKFRQFVKPQLMIGMNRLASDSLTINDGYGINGFNSVSLTGKSRLLFTLQTQSYPPWNFVGFRFGPYLSYSLGMLGDEATGFKKRKVYSQIGLGVLIKNVNLVLNTFQISLAFYPSIPGIGQDLFKFNSFNTGDFGFRDFEFGKPSVIRFE